MVMILRMGLTTGATSLACDHSANESLFRLLAFRPGVLETAGRDARARAQRLGEQGDAKLLQQPAEFVVAGWFESALGLHALAVARLQRRDLGGQLGVASRVQR